MAKVGLDPIVAISKKHLTIEACMGETPMHVNMRRDWIICIALAGVTIAVYSRATTYPFISYDDRESFTDNPHVNQGFST
jgi:hypothetical protein